MKQQQQQKQIRSSPILESSGNYIIRDIRRKNKRTKKISRF